MDILLIFVIFIAVMWFLMIRPQQKRQREHKQMIESLTRGDDVVTIGGMHGRVDGIAEGYVDLEVTDDLVLRFQKEAIARKVVAGDPESATP